MYGCTRLTSVQYTRHKKLPFSLSLNKASSLHPSITPLQQHQHTYIINTHHQHLPPIHTINHSTSRQT